MSTRIFRALAKVGSLPKVTTLIAPPGYGKTILIIQLHHELTQQGVKCFWIGVDGRNDDLAALLTLVEQAIGVQRGDSLDPIARDHWIELNHRIDDIIGWLIQREDEVAFFFDNINGLVDAEIAHLIDALIFRTRASSRILMSSCNPIPFDIARARMELNLRRITMTELSFDHEATAAMVKDAGLDDLSEETIGAIVSKTEGWPAAVRLMQLIMSGEPAGEQYRAILGGGRRSRGPPRPPIDGHIRSRSRQLSSRYIPAPQLLRRVGRRCDWRSPRGRMDPLFGRSKRIDHIARPEPYVVSLSRTFPPVPGCRRRPASE